MVDDAFRAAPTSEMFFTVHSRFGALSVVTMRAAFNTRRRGKTRLSFTDFSKSDSGDSIEEV